jgi:hypothetical protein
MKSLVFHLALLLVGAALSYGAQRDATDKKKDGEVTVVDGAVLGAIRYANEDGTLTITRDERAPKEQASAYVVTLVRLVVDETAPKAAPAPPPAAADAGVEGDGGASAPEPPKVERTFTFPPSKSLTRAIEKLFPLIARRSLDDVPADRLAAMGLDAPKASISVTVDGKEHTFDVGARTYGGQARYLRDRATGRVHLLDGTTISGLEGTEAKLSERKVISDTTDDIVKIVLAEGPTERAFVHVEREQAAKRYFAAVGAESERVDAVDGALDALKKLRATRYLDDTARAGREPVITFAIERADAPPEKGVLFAPVDGKALVAIGRWTIEVGEAPAKDVVDDVRAALQTP